MCRPWGDLVDLERCSLPVLMIRPPTVPAPLDTLTCPDTIWFIRRSCTPVLTTIPDAILFTTKITATDWRWPPRPPPLPDSPIRRPAESHPAAVSVRSHRRRPHSSRLLLPPIWFIIRWLLKNSGNIRRFRIYRRHFHLYIQRQHWRQLKNPTPLPPPPEFCHHQLLPAAISQGN